MIYLRINHLRLYWRPHEEKIQKIQKIKKTSETRINTSIASFLPCRIAVELVTPAVTQNLLNLMLNYSNNCQVEL